MSVIDITPTIYEVCGITPPRELNGVQQKPLEGTSIAYTFDDAKAAERHTVQYFEMGCNRGIYQDGWMASAISFEPWNPNRAGFDPDKQKWELYHIDEDFSQADDLAAQNPAKLRQLQDLWWVEAAKYSVLPLDWRVTERFNSELMGRPSLTRGRKSFTYYPGTIGLPDAASPPMLNKSWTITADIDLAEGNESGMIITQGGLEGGYGLYLKDGKPTFVYNFLGMDRPTFTATNALPKGKTKLTVDFKYDGPGDAKGAAALGKGGTITITANDKVIAQGRLERTIPAQFSLGEGLDIGMDIGSPVDFTYKLPFKFTGTIEQVVIDLK
jgi:arylsulfatase